MPRFDGLRLGILCAVAAAAYALGAATVRWNLPPYREYQAYVSSTRIGGFSDTRQKTPVPCPAAGARTAVLLALGQSNAANSGAFAPARHAASGVVNVFDGRCFTAGDPLLGGDGAGTSIWPHLGDRLLATGAYDAVVVAVFAVNDTPLHRWVDERAFGRHLDQIAESLRRASLMPTAILWAQGEADARIGTTTEDYVNQFQRFASGLRSRGLTAPIYLAASTLCARPPEPRIRAARERLIGTNGIVAGPDTDALGFGFRFDGCHFTGDGQARAAELWSAALTR